MGGSGVGDRVSGEAAPDTCRTVGGRPVARQMAYMFAVRSITKGSLFRAEYEALCQRNGGAKMKAVVAVMRSGLRLLSSVARDRRLFTVEAPIGRRAAA